MKGMRLAGKKREESSSSRESPFKLKLVTTETPYGVGCVSPYLPFR
jgi:hypothetical protein